MSSARIEELRKKFDENPRRYFAPLANEYRKAGDFDQAIFICQEYLPQQPGHMSGHIVFGQALFEAKRLPEAKVVFETALSLDPENLIALRHLADISRDLGDTAAARGWYERVLHADPRNEEIAGIMAQLGGATAAPAADAAAAPTGEAPVVAPRPVAKTLPDAGAALAAAPTVELSAAAIQELVKARQASKQPAEPQPEPETQHEKLTLDTTPTVEINAASADAAPMEGLEPTSQAGMLDLPQVETLGLETNAAPGIPAEAAAPPPLDGLDTIPLDLGSLGTPTPSAPAAPPPAPEPVSAPAGDGLLDLDSSFSLGGSPEPAAAPAPSAAETPIDGGHDSDGLIDLDFGTPAAPPAPVPELETVESIPTMIIDAVKSVVPAVQDAVESAMPAMLDAVESAAPAVMDFVDTTIPSVVDTVKTAVEAVAETPTMVIEAIKPPAKTETPAPRTSGSAERPSQSVPFVTETMAQLYLSQGHRTEAIDIYRKLIEARPGDAELKARLAAIESEERGATVPKSPEAPSAPAPRRFTGSGPSIRVVLRELFGLDGSASYSAAPASAAPAVPAETGSIDMLFASDGVADALTPLAVAFDGGYVAAQGSIDELFAGGGR